MKQAFGVGLVLLGAAFFHIASSGTLKGDEKVSEIVSTIWDDMISIAQGNVNPKK